MKNIVIQQLFNFPVNSNCYVLHSDKSNECIVIDPGTVDNHDLKKYIAAFSLVPKYIVLTHHHFDHIWGVNDLIVCFQPQVICSQACAERIIDSKLNLSAYYSETGFVLAPAAILVEQISYTFTWQKHGFEFLPSKGHSQSCISILVDNCIFTGDSLIKNAKTVTKLPGGSKTDLEETFLKYKEILLLKKDLTVYPGHGEIFDLKISDL